MNTRILVLTFYSLCCILLQIYALEHHIIAMPNLLLTYLIFYLFKRPSCALIIPGVCLELFLFLQSNYAGLTIFVLSLCLLFKKFQQKFYIKTFAPCLVLSSFIVLYELFMSYDLGYSIKPITTCLQLLVNNGVLLLQNYTHNLLHKK